MELIYVSAQDIPRVWTHLKFPPSSSPERIWRAMTAGTAFLVLFRKNAKLDGFAVFEIDGESLHIWVLHSNSGLEHLQQLETEARKLGTKRISFLASRRGWERRAPEIGFYPVEVMYEKRL